MSKVDPSELVYREDKKGKWTGPQIILSVVIILISLTCLLPFVNVAAISLSSKSAILSGKVSPSGRLPFTFWGALKKNPAQKWYPAAPQHQQGDHVPGNGKQAAARLAALLQHALAVIRVKPFRINIPLSFITLYINFIYKLE